MTALILGSSGWVAHYLIPELQTLGLDVIGISQKNNPKHSINNTNHSIESDDFIDEVRKISCDVIINMLHSKNYKKSAILNEKISKHCIETKIHYFYMSSANALDGESTKPHIESDLANGGSDYGKYKAECEHYLYAHHPKSCILRFPATHGYAPNRIARTEDFLQKLNNSQTVSIFTGVFQNRPYVGHLAKMMARIIKDKHSGIFHLGTKEQSDEFDFFKNLALAFGYPDYQVSKGEKHDFYLTVFPKRIYELYGNEFLFSEQDTIKELLKSDELQKYIKKH